MGFFGKIAKRFTGEARAANKEQRYAARERRMKIRQGGKSERDLIGESGQSQRAEIDATSRIGFAPSPEDPTTPSAGKPNKFQNFIDKAGGFLGNLLGTNQQPQYNPNQQPSNNDKMPLIIGGIAIVGLLAFFGLKKKK